jgi:hypothetical protein
VKKIWRAIVAVLLVGGWALAALSLHVVRTPERLVVIPKNTLGVSDTYVDTRAWTLNDAAAHSEFVKRLVVAGKAHALEHLSDLKKGEDLDVQLMDVVKRGPTSMPTTGPTKTIITVGTSKRK